MNRFENFTDVELSILDVALSGCKIFWPQTQNMLREILEIRNERRGIKNDGKGE